MEKKVSKQGKNPKAKKISKKDLELICKEDWSEVNRSILAYIDWRDNAKSPTASLPLRKSKFPLL